MKKAIVSAVMVLALAGGSVFAATKTQNSNAGTMKKTTMKKKTTKKHKKAAPKKAANKNM